MSIDLSKVGVIQKGRTFKKPICSFLPPHVTLCQFPWLSLPPDVTSDKLNCPKIGKIRFSFFVEG